MLTDQVAVISDIHGNRWALEAVLDDIDRRGIDNIVNLGDSLYGPLDPAGTADMLLWLDQPGVSGNEDRLIIEAPGAPDESPTLRFVKDSLSPEHIRWLKGLPPACNWFDYFMCHGCPDRDDDYLLGKVTEDGVADRIASELADVLSGVGEPVVLCGHDHVPRVVRLGDDKLVVNPGSVGLPAYAEYLPFPHAMETGTPHARYSIVFRSERGWRVENIAVPYDWETAAGVALENERPDWAEWLRTGRATAAQNRRNT